jgi:hypothetical protein
MAVDYNMPLVLTTTMEDLVGSTIDDLQKLAPQAYANRYERGGQLSCWDDAALTNGVKALKRKNIILAGAHHGYMCILGMLRRAAPGLQRDVGR